MSGADRPPLRVAVASSDGVQVDLIDDCAVVLALQVGPAFRQELERRGVRVLTGEGPIAPLLARIGASYLGRARARGLRSADTPIGRKGS